MATPEILKTEIPYREDRFRLIGFEEHLSGESLYNAGSDLPISSFSYRIVKPLIDILIVVLTLPIAIPLGVIIAALIRFHSKGSILYRHRRIGQYQQTVYVWKFRTMYENSGEVLEQHLSSDPDARQEWMRTHKLRDDPRVTPIGRLLRKTSLDEIPQLLNVLAGDMSIVGPRPIVDEERAKYGRHFHTYTYALPGITGLWQVSGRCDVDYPERVQMDVQYVKQWSLWMEVKILLKTASAILHSRGAY